MLFSIPGARGPSLVSPEFLALCIKNKVQATIQPFPNPGDIYRCCRKIIFKSFNDKLVEVTQKNKQKKSYTIPIRGELEIMLLPGEDLPLVKEID
jgi:hypothetical protein